MKYDFVYYYKERDSSKELRYSLRSIDKNTNINHVYVLGEAPKWLRNTQELTHISIHQPTMPIGEVAWFYVREALKIKELNDEFILMNDDFYILKQLNEINQVYRSNLDYLQKAKSNNTYHLKTLRAFTFLKIIGINTEMKFNLHTPMLLKKDIVIKCLEYHDKYQFRDVDFRTFYGNLENSLEPNENLYAIDDVKNLYLYDKDLAYNHTYMSTGNYTFERVEDFLHNQFPTPCQWES